MDKNQLLNKIYSKVEELPTLPVVIPKLLKLIEDDKSDAAGVTELISKDPALTSKILKVANSAYYGFSGKISELEHAVALLGFNMVKSLALSIGVIDTLPRGKKTKYFSREGLWLHSLAVAMIIEELGKKVYKKNKNESLFIIGLLHDTGKVVLDQFFHDEFLDILEYVYENQDEKLHEVEKSKIGVCHSEISGMLLKRWQFPDSIRNPISYHHIHELPEEVSREDLALLRVSNIIAQELELGHDGNVTPNNYYQKDLDVLNIGDEELKEIKKFAESIKTDIQEFFSAMI